MDNLIPGCIYIDKQDLRRKVLLNTVKYPYCTFFAVNDERYSKPRVIDMYYFKEATIFSLLETIKYFREQSHG